MIPEHIKLVSDILDLKSLDQKPIREGFGLGLVEAADANQNVVGLCADLTESTKMEAFAKRYPERFVEIGVAEQNLAAVASGMAACGKIPFISSYAMFSPGRNWEQIRTTICYNERHVIIAGSHAGVSVGPDGATHQAIEDIAIMRPIANMTVIAPCDAHEARKATVAASGLSRPVYIRLAREKTPVFTTPETPFQIGKAYRVWEPTNPPPLVAIIACGSLVHNAILAAQELEKESIGVLVVNNHTIKPMDEETIIAAAKGTGAVVTVEEHQVMGGMGSAVAEVLARTHPVPMEFVGVQNRFGESGEPAELLEKFGMGVSSIVAAVKRVVQRK
ncbi:MAG: transketolase [Candidatus Ryanbacteria bacterium RIFCSPHIGHO2_02_FULL_45_17b]|uniref:Transketolase n=1 Tax=Candidatus Ryanbacteria bacterium RIFCSPHIGHO2_01_FULL_45_22 TaxID=1802114 RepID=A0A1G2G2D7_9BACT|nr:MAG: transketolase [Candidatus Ryanbacteria bacterium RIFCSPHIGHO2_01_FULL_45_22]OGZ47163.1 MAG: transketolase [Candidatus Ryanbacteria bacterium RIFCSPHIGHO2_02_FULL_45_17b]